MKNDNYCIINSPFPDWKNILLKNNKITYFDNITKIDISNYKIIAISIENYKLYNNLENNIFNNDLNNIEILNNKSLFGNYMKEKFIEYIPTIYYYNYNDITYINKPLENILLIIKPNIGYGSCGIKIGYNIFDKFTKNCIISKYIPHTIYYSGHFLVLNGIIIKKVYFYANKSNKQLVIKGRIANYKIIDKLNIDDTIFDKIFIDLKYSGFACVDFIISNNNIIIFEINPRPGGSLIHNNEFFNIFIDKLKYLF
jgi:predicted ATP-grasp superfamily ATP-dependent carboligase